jgi:hypothetical protein
MEALRKSGVDGHPDAALAITAYFSGFHLLRPIPMSRARHAAALHLLDERTQLHVQSLSGYRMRIWIPIAILAIVLIAFAGLAPLPGQKDNATPHTQPSNQSPQVQAPKGPPPSPPSEAGRGTQPPPGGTPAASPGGPTDKASGQTMTSASPKRDADSPAAR